MKIEMDSNSVLVAIVGTMIIAALLIIMSLLVMHKDVEIERLRLELQKGQFKASPQVPPQQKEQKTRNLANHD